MNFRDSALVLAWMLIVLLSLGLAGILRQVRVLDDGVRKVFARSLQRDTADDRNLRQTVDEILPGIDSVIAVFVSPGCGSCQDLLNEISAVETALAMVVLSDGLCPPGSPNCVSFSEGRRLRNGVIRTPSWARIEQGGEIVDLCEGNARVFRSWLQEHRLAGQGSIPQIKPKINIPNRKDKS